MILSSSAPARPKKIVSDRGFARVDLLMMCAALAMAGILTFPLIANPRADSDRAVCFNNLRQLGRAALEYTDENDSTFPSRRPPAWPTSLSNYYGTTNILSCPADGPTQATFGATNADAAPRSYLMNGWSDYFMARTGLPPFSPMPVSAIQQPAETIVFGEKKTESGHFWMDYSAIDDSSEIEQSRHYATRPNQTDGASNHAFVDGSVRLLRFGAALHPVLLWAVEPEFRTNTVPQ